VRKILPVALGVVAASLAACGASATGSSSGSPSATPHGSAPKLTPTPGGGAIQPTATPGAIDPCTLLTQEAASQLAGVALGPGEVTGGGRLCLFTGGNTQVDVSAVQTPSDAAAETALQEERADLAKDGDIITPLPNFADEAYFARVSTAGITLSGIYVRSGADFISVVTRDPAASDTALKFAATLVLGALP